MPTSPSIHRPAPILTTSTTSSASSSSSSPTITPTHQSHSRLPDTTRRHNYRPTPLPADHIRNSSSALLGGRWLSEDEGVNTVKKSGTEEWLGPSGSGSSAGGSSTKDQGELERVKMRWRELAGERQAGVPSTSAAGGRRLRRTVSTEETDPRHPSAIATSNLEPTAQTCEGQEEQPPTPLSGHPIASNASGLPMPPLRDLAPPPSNRQTGVQMFPASGSSSIPASVGIPDYAQGHGGDGTTGSQTVEPNDDGMSANATVQMKVREREREKEKRRLLVQKLSGVLKCPCCPVDEEGQSPYLNHPVTLYCGHTVSSAHANIPFIPRPDTSGFSEMDAHGIMAAYQARKLHLWSKVPCPLPGCKRFLPQHPERDMGERCPETIEIPVIKEKGMMDVNVAKVLALVQKQMAEDEAEEDRAWITVSRTISRETDVGTETDEAAEDADVEDEETFAKVDKPRRTLKAAPGRDLALRALAEGERSPKLVRTSSKRRRNTAQSSDQSSPPMKRTNHLPDEYAEDENDQQRPILGRRKPSVSFEKELTAVLECDVCAQLLYEPVTTHCQHTFCSKCLARSLDHSSKCPLCRQDLPTFDVFQDHAINRVLESIVITAFPAEHAERKRCLEDDERDTRLDTPIFVCTLAFPGMPTILHVFEPRYRLMLRRCIESGTPRFGMVLPSRGAGNPGVAGVLEYGTMLDIRSIQMLPDGRSMVETTGSYRFRLLEKGSLDGYTVGRVERIEDITPEAEAALEQLSVQRSRASRAEASASGNPLEEGAHSRSSSPRPPLFRSAMSGRPASAGASAPVVSGSPAPPAAGEREPTTVELMASCQEFIEQLRSGSAPWLLQRLNNTYGEMPTDPSTFSYWMALVMPIDEYEKARLLPIRSPRLRLRLIVHWVEQLRSSWWWVLPFGHRFLFRSS